MVVSPRKRILQTNIETRSNTPLEKAKSRGLPQPFRNYKFYLDIRAKTPSSLLSEIKNLGGQIEECLSKEVTHVISDTPESKFPTSHSSLGPPSPWTPSQTPSPATSTSAVDSEKRRCPTAPPSRAEAILAKVRNSSAKLINSGAVLETAKRLNCQIWSLSKTLQWLEKFRAKYGSSRSSRKPVEARVERKALISPSIKLENEANNTRPVHQELRAWPELRFDGRPGSSPYSTPSNSRHKNKKLSKRLDKDKEETPKKVTKNEEKQSTSTQKKKASGFCEICNLNFSDLEKHLVTSQHQQFIADQLNWTEVDELVSDWSWAEL